MGEFDLIKTYFAPLAGPEGLKLLDDAACFTPDLGYDLVLTKDTMVEGVHFPVGPEMRLIAQRLMRVNLSDLAAKGAEPKGYLLSIAWPSGVKPKALEKYAQDFAAGLQRDQDRFRFKLFGGDTVSIFGPMVVSATFIGQVPAGLMIKRSGAKVGDDIWVTGSLGDSYLGLQSLRNLESVSEQTTSCRQFWEERYCRPNPRLEIGLALRKYATSCADISDGVFADASNIAGASNVRMTIKLGALPLSDITLDWLEIQEDDRRLDLLTFGDDYELIFTASPEHRGAIELLSQNLGVRTKCVGQCSAGIGVNCMDEGGHTVVLETPGYRHF